MDWRVSHSYILLHRLSGHESISTALLLQHLPPRTASSPNPLLMKWQLEPACRSKYISFIIAIKSEDINAT